MTRPVLRAAAAFVAALLASGAQAQPAPPQPQVGPEPVMPTAPGVEARYVRLGNNAPGMYYVSAAPKGDVALFYMHSGADYLENVGCKALSARGWRILCANSSATRDQEVRGPLGERWLADAARAITWLRGQPGVGKVVIMGHSGGGAMMSQYAAVSAAGVAACRGPHKLSPCSDAVANLPKVDGVILLDANYGLSSMTLFSIDGSLLSEASAQKFDPALDLWNPANGFTPTGAKYPPAFAARWFKAVGARNNRLIDAALARKKAIDAGQGVYADDEPYDVPGAIFLGSNNKFFSQDPRYLAHTKGQWPLIHKDGSITVETIRTVRVPSALTRQTAGWGATEQGTVVHFLDQNAVRTTPAFKITEDGIEGVVWASSNNTPAGNAPFITQPLLALGMTGNWEYLNSELIYNAAGAKDKTLAFVEGATHPFYTCKRCETVPGQYGDTVKTTFDYVDSWLSKPGRF